MLMLVTLFHLNNAFYSTIFGLHILGYLAVDTFPFKKYFGFTISVPFYLRVALKLAENSPCFS